MVTLRCRTPAEAFLVQENLESEGVIALVPKEEQMLLQFRKSGYVEVQVPAAAYDSTGDLRSAVEFSTIGRAGNDPDADRPLLIEKLIATLLGVIIVPGLLIFALLLTSYIEKGRKRKAKELKLWFLVGVGAWVLIILACVVFWA